VLSNLGESADAEKTATRAFELRDKASERERLYIEARYYTTVVKDQNKAIESYRVLLATYPDDYAAHSNLGSLYRNVGRHDEAIKHLEEAVRLGPNQPLGRGNLGGAYIDEGRYAEARQQFEEVLKLQESLGARTALVTVGTLMGDQTLVDEHLAVAATDERTKREILGVRVGAAAYKGQMKEAARLTDDLFRLVKDTNLVSQASEGLIGLAINQAAAGRVDEARRQAQRVVGDPAFSQGAHDEMVALGAILRDKTMIDTYLAASIKRLTTTAQPQDAQKAERGMKALAALGREDYEQAYELGMSNGTDASQRNSMFVAGLAALRLQRWPDAAKIFETLIGFGPRIGLSPQHAFFRIMLGRAHAGAGRTAEARKAYEEAFKIWKDADPDLPLLLDARKEYERLSS
jgi:tetratricopeptide (TPR) repeat protein